MARTSSLRREPLPSSAAMVTSSHERPVDLVHLSHQTMGDAALEREILGLLARQIGTLSGRLQVGTAAERSRVAHALRGAALNVGAFRLARAAEAVEASPACSEAVAGFEREMEIVSGFVADLLGGSAASR